MKKLQIEFYEHQSKKQWWLWVILIGIDLLFIFGCIQQLIFDNPFGNNPMSNTGLIVLVVCMLFVSFAVLSAALHTYINSEGIFVKFFPFQFRYRFYDWNTIRSSYVTTYNPVREYGGWGVRIGNNGTKAYTMSGNMGLQIILKNGKKVLIGTNQADHLKMVLMKLDKMEQMKDG